MDSVHRSLVLVDNLELLDAARTAAAREPAGQVEVACSPQTWSRLRHASVSLEIGCVSVREESAAILEKFQCIVSLHCKQIFPSALVSGARCVNFHPGFNPFNRGVFPHVFSMLNGLPTGVTIHEMDDRIDHGPIIHREEIPISSYETSFEVYSRILARQKSLFLEFLPRVIRGDYETFSPEHEGNLNTLADFAKLCRIDPEIVTTPKAFLAFLRAMTFDGMRNAFFEDPQTGKRRYVRVQIEREEECP